VDSWATLKKYRDELGLPFDLLSDWDRESSKKYGAFNKKEGVTNRMSLLIDKNGVIRFTQESGLETPRKHEDMINAVRNLSAKETAGSPTGKETAVPVDAIFYEFYAETCPHCQKMKPVVEEFREKYGSRFKKFLLIPRKGSENYSLFHEYEITGTPTFLITDMEGKEIDRISGVVRLKSLVSFMESSFKRIRK
jgi:thioredoxin 1